MDDGSFWSSLPMVLTAIGGVLTAGATLVGALYSAGLIGRGRRGAAPTPEPARTEAPVTPAVTPGVTRPVTAASPGLRRIPGILSADQAKVLLVRQGIYDARWNATADGVQPHYEIQAAGDALIVRDDARGIAWQRGGSPRPLPFAEAEAYVRQLNVELFAGHGDWRLPTLEEAGTLLTSEPHAGLHLDPVFEKGAPFVWTTDRHPDGRIWMIYFADGQIDCERPAFNAWVRAVCETERGTAAVPPR